MKTIHVSCNVNQGFVVNEPGLVRFRRKPTKNRIGLVTGSFGFGGMITALLGSIGALRDGKATG